MENNEKSAMRNEQSAINNQQSIISNQQSAINYNENHANKMYSGAIASNHGVKHIVSAFYLAKQAGVNIDEVRQKRAEERRKQREKCSNVQMFSGITFSHVGARTLYNGKMLPMVQLIPAMPMWTMTTRLLKTCPTLFLGMVDAIGSTLSPYVRTMYGDKWMYPNIQVFWWHHQHRVREWYRGAEIS